MNGFIIRHAERIREYPCHLTPKGKQRAERYATVLYKLFYEKFGNVPEAIYLKPPDEIYGIQCQQTMIPMALDKNIPIIHFKNEVNLDLRHRNVIICSEHRMIVHLLEVYFKIKADFPFFWSDDNFCTVIHIHQGQYVGAFPFYMEENETEIFQRFMKRVPFSQHCHFLYKKQDSNESFHHLPRQVLEFLEFFLSVFPYLSERIKIFGGWIRNILLNEVDPKIHDIDVVFPLDYSTYKEFLDWVDTHPTCINLNIYLRRTVREEENIIVAHFNFIENGRTIALDMSNYSKNDFDFTCNSGFIHYPSLDDIGFQYKRGERDLMERRLMPCSSTVGLDRYLKMLKLGFQVVDTAVLRDLKDKIYQESYLLTRQDMVELCRYCSITIPSRILLLPEYQYASILLLGWHRNVIQPTPSYEAWLYELDTHLDPCATITTGIYHPENIISHTIKYLIQQHPSRKVKWIRWSNAKEKVSEKTVQEFRKNVPLGEMKIISNILFRTAYLLEEEHDKIFVFPGKEGTKMEMLTVNLMNRSFDKVPMEDNDNILECLILGGGVAGITCFQELWKNEYHNIALLEASAQIGGRVKETEWDGKVISQGALWIQGIKENEFYDTHIKGRFECVQTDFSSLQWMNHDSDALRKDMEKLKVIIGNSVHDKENQSIQSYFHQQGFIPNTLSKFMAEKILIDFEYGEESKNISVRNIAHQIYKNHFHNPSVYVKGGIQQIVENMVPEEGRENIYLNEKVVSVKESKNFFIVQTASGKSYRAKNIVCTFSLGFLTKNPSILPSLAWKEVEREHSLVMAHYDTVYIKLDRIFWDIRKEFILFGDGNRYTITMNLGHEKYYPGEPILILFLLAKQAKEFEMLTSEEEKKKRIKQWIPPENSPYNIESFCFKSWSDDQFTYGSFSFRYFQKIPSSLDRTPPSVYNKNIYFAGEHMSVDNGYIQGAYESAKNVAHELLRKQKTRTKILGRLVSKGSFPVEGCTNQVVFRFPSNVVCPSPSRIVSSQNGGSLLVVEDGYYIFDFTAVGHPSQQKTYTMTFTFWNETMKIPLGQSSSMTFPCLPKTTPADMQCPLFFKGFLRKNSRVVILVTLSGTECSPRECLFYVSGPIYVDPVGDLALRCIQYDSERTVRFIPLSVTDNPSTPPTNLIYYGWSNSVLPSSLDQTLYTKDLIQQPTFVFSPVPPVPPLERINKDVYLKTNSLPYSVYFYRGVDPFTSMGFHSKLSVITVNLDERGIDNYRKKIYMLAFTEDKFAFYKEKVNSFLYEMYDTVKNVKDQPVLGFIKNRLIRFFLAMHVGYDDYPKEVIYYFEQFMVLLGHTSSSDALSIELMMKGYKEVPFVEEYFQKRLAEIIYTKDKSTILFWWFTAGYPSDSLLFEAVHNIIAFHQYMNLFYKLIVDEFGRGTKVPLFQTLSDGSVGLGLRYETRYYRFFEKFRNATTDELKLNIVREIFRLLVPSATSNSSVQSADPATNNVLNYHVHQSLMATNDPTYHEFKPETNYTGFETRLNDTRCPFMSTTDVNAYFEHSNVDEETILHRSNPKLFPVYASPPQGPGPKYCPFGLGYRRCPSEAFNYWIIIKWMEVFQDAMFEFRDEFDAPLIYIAVSTAVPDNIFSVCRKNNRNN